MDTPILQKLSASGKLGADTQAKVDAMLAQKAGIAPVIDPAQANALAQAASRDAQYAAANPETVPEPQLSMDEIRAKYIKPEIAQVATVPVQSTTLAQPIDPSQYDPAYTPPAPAPAQPTVQQQTSPINQPFDKLSKSLEGAVAMGADAAAKENALAAGYMAEQNKFAKEQNDVIDAQFEAAQKKQLEAQELIDKVANKEIDPNRVFNNMGTGQKVAVFALSALAGNQGSQYLDRLVEQDVKAQTDQKNTLLEAAKGRKTMYSQLLDQFKDKQSAKYALKAMQYQAMQTQINALGSQSKNAEFQAKSAGIGAEIENKRNDALAEFTKRQQLLSATNISPETKINQIQDEKTRERFVPGLGLAASKEDATKLKEQGATTYSALGNINALKKYIGKPFNSISPQARAEIQSEIGTLVGAMRVPIVGPGAFTDSEREFVKDLIGDPSKLFSLDSTTKAKLAKLESILLRSRNVTAKAYGLDPAPLAEDLINPNRVK
jgi:hypothetical protein